MVIHLQGKLLVCESDHLPPNGTKVKKTFNNYTNHIQLHVIHRDSVTLLCLSVCCDTLNANYSSDWKYWDVLCTLSSILMYCYAL